MKRKDWWVWYNPQNLTENQFILVTTVPNSAEDTWELIPVLDKFYDKYNTFPENNLADKGYASEENYEYLEKNNVLIIGLKIPLAFNVASSTYIFNSANVK